MTMSLTNNLANRNNYYQCPQSTSFKAVSGNFLDKKIRTAAIQEDLKLYYKLNNRKKSNPAIRKQARILSYQIYNAFKPIIEQLSKIPKEKFNLKMNIKYIPDSYHNLVVSIEANGSNSASLGNLLCAAKENSRLKKNLTDKVWIH